MRLSTVLYGAMQLVVLGGVILMNERMRAETGEGMGGPALGVLWLVTAAIATAAVYWSIEGLRRALGKPPSAPIITPKSAFDNLRPRRSVENTARPRKS